MARLKLGRPLVFQKVEILDAVVTIGREQVLEGPLVVRIKGIEGTAKVSVELLSEILGGNASVGGSNVAGQGNVGRHHLLVS